MARHAALWWLASCLPLAFAVRRESQALSSFLRRSTPSHLNETGFTPGSGGAPINVTSKQREAVVKQVSSKNASEKQPGLPGLFASMDQRCEVMELYPDKPEVCTQGGTWNKKDLIEGLNYFVHMWRVYQEKFSHLCCTGVNHLFAVFFTTGRLQPPAVIQAGVSSGQMTWWLRMTVPNAQIFALERIDPEMIYSGLTDVWLDDSPKTKYFTGANFVDALDANWKELIPDAGVRAKTLVILSDHRSCIEQFKVLQAAGFRHFLYMDNYPYEMATSAEEQTCKDQGLGLKRDYPVENLYGDAYSPAAICDKKVDPSTTSLLYKDKAGRSCKQIGYHEHMSNVGYMQKNMLKYYEFPPVYTKCKHRWDVPLNRKQLLYTVEMPAMFPKPEYEVLKYGHLFPAYVELVSADVAPNATFPGPPAAPKRPLEPPPPISIEGEVNSAKEDVTKNETLSPQ